MSGGSGSVGDVEGVAVGVSAVAEGEWAELLCWAEFDAAGDEGGAGGWDVLGGEDDFVGGGGGGIGRGESAAAGVELDTVGGRFLAGENLEAEGVEIELLTLFDVAHGESNTFEGCEYEGLFVELSKVYFGSRVAVMNADLAGVQAWRSWARGVARERLRAA